MKTRISLLPGSVRIIPQDYPEHRIIDNMRRYEAWKNKNLGVQGAQVQAFMVLRQVHAYIAAARHELEGTLGTPLCREHCCCLRSTPLVTRLEAEYIISCNGLFSHLLEIAEDWLLTPHEAAPTYPSELPAVLGGGGTPLRELPAVGREMRALANLRSPFLLAERDSMRERIISGPYAKTSYASGTSLVHAENWDLLEETQPLTCAVSGVFKRGPDFCTRRLGIGENTNTRAIGQPDTLKAVVHELDKVYDAYPDKAVYGLLPTMIVLAANPNHFRELVISGKVALAKVGIATNKFPISLWEEHPYGRAERRFTSSSAGRSGGA